MKTSFWQKLKKFIAEYSKYSHWHKVAVCMAAVVAVLTVSALVLPAITMGRDAYCGMEEHKHTAECSEKQLVCEKAENKAENNEESIAVKKALSCPLKLHQHKESCYNSNKEIICGYADYVVHQHSENCYDEAGTLVCTLPEVKEHTHEASCYTEEKQLVCTVAETAGHTHTEACYTMVETGNINCIAPEEEGHVHTEECYEKVKTLTCGQEEVPAHAHTDGCYQTVKHCVCGKPEVILHKHDEVHCYSTDDNGNKYLSCGMLEVLSHEHDEKCFQEVQAEEEEHVHTEECYEDVLVCEKTEHTHEDSCFDKKAAETETVKQSESDGSAETTETEQTVWTTQDNKAEINAAEAECGKEEHIHAEACYSNSGDFICELEEHTHELACYPEEVQNVVNEVNQAIEALPTYDELSGKFAAYEEAGDEDGYNAYYQEIAAQVKAVYEAYNALDAKFQTFIPAENVETLNSYASFLVMGTPESTGTADTDLKDYLQSVTITDKDGNPPKDDKVYIGQNYKIKLRFAESGDNQFNTGVDTWTYRLPTGLKVTESKQNQKMTITIIENDTPVDYEATYDIIADNPSTNDISNDGLIKIHLTDVLKEKINNSGDVSFGIDLSAEVSDDGGDTLGNIVFEGSCEGTEFHKGSKPLLSVEKSGQNNEIKDENENSTGGNIVYTVTGGVVNGPVNGLTFVDEGSYPEEYFGNAQDVQKNMTIESVKIICTSNETNSHASRELGKNDYRLTWDNSSEKPTFTLKLNEDIQLTDKCDTVEIVYTVPYTVPPGVSYFRLDVDNSVTFSGTTVQPADGPEKEPTDPVKITNQVPIEGNLNGKPGIVKTLDDKNYLTQDKLHYTIRVNVAAGNYKPFLLVDDLTVLLDGKTYRVDARPENLQVTIRDITGREIEPTRLADDWVAQKSDPNYVKGLNLEGDYYGYFDKHSLEWSWVPVGTFNILFNPVLHEANEWWGEDTSLNVEKNSVVEVSYDIDVDKNIDLYLCDEAGNIIKGETPLTVNLKDYLENTSAILSNLATMQVGSTWNQSKVYFNKGEKLRKAGKPNADGTIDYAVTLWVDKAVREVLKESEADNGGYYDLDFYDKLPEGWEYVEGSLKVVPEFGTWKPTFYYLDSFREKEYAQYKDTLISKIGNNLSPVTEDGTALKASWTGFSMRQDGAYNAWNLENAVRYNIDKVETPLSFTFSYTLKPTDAAGNEHGPEETIWVHNEASILSKDIKKFNAVCDLPYAPIVLSKTAKQKDEGSNSISFKIDINPAGVDLIPDDNVIQVTDTMGPNLILKPDTVEVTYENGEIVTDYTMTTDKFLDNGEGGDGKYHEQFVLNGLPDDRHLIIHYEALVTEYSVDDKSVAISNTAEIKGFDPQELSGRTRFQINDTSGSGQGTLFYFTLRKVDQDNETKKLKGAKFNVYAATPVTGETDGTKTILTFNKKGVESRYSIKPIGGTITTNEKGEAEVQGADIRVGNYYVLEEVEAPKGYIKSEKPNLVYFKGSTKPEAEVDSNADVIDINYLYTVKNEAYKVELPETGGTGTIPYTMAGIALIAIAALIYKNEVTKNKKVKGE